MVSDNILDTNEVIKQAFESLQYNTVRFNVTDTDVQSVETFEVTSTGITKL